MVPRTIRGDTLVTRSCRFTETNQKKGCEIEFLSFEKKKAILVVSMDSVHTVGSHSHNLKSHVRIRYDKTNMLSLYLYYCFYNVKKLYILDFRG